MNQPTTSAKVPVRLMCNVATADRCSCGAAIEVTEVYPGEWQASCPDCLDPTEDAPRTQHVYGFGKTATEALWAWAEDHEDAHEIEWWPTRTVLELEAQVRTEATRQAGWEWHLVDGPDCGNYYGPALRA